MFLFFGHRWVCFLMLECPTTKKAPTRSWLGLPSLSTMVCTGLDSPAKCVKKNHSDSFIFKVKKFSLYPTNIVQLCTIPAAAVERSHMAESPCHFSSHWRLPFVHCPRRSREWYPWSCHGRRAPTNVALWRPLKIPQHQHSKS